MTGMMPDSGVPASDAKNSILDPNTVNCDELWYSTSRCQPRFDPAAANAVLAELINAVNCAGIPYDCSKLTNLCDAIAYTVQNGDSWCAPLTNGPNDYLGALNPPLLAYPTADCCMAIKVIPNVNNAAGGTRVNFNNLGWISVVRNDGEPLQANDWTAGIPVMIIYCNGRFVSIGMVGSQVPKPLSRPLDLWVNNSFGSDAHDGLSNDPAHALNTFQRAIDIAYSYQPGQYPVNIHIMNGSGPYAGGMSPQYAGPSLHVIGEGPNTRLVDTRFCFHVQGPNNASLDNVSVQQTGPLGGGGTVSSGSGASLAVNRIYAQSAPGGVLQASRNGSMVINNCTYYGNAYCLFYLNFGGSMEFTDQQQTTAQALSVTVATMFCGGATGGIPGSCPAWIGPGLVTGSKYSVSGNGVINDQTPGKNFFAGTVAGTTATGGQYI
jgi:hypothetical protein